ncbi:MAG TPA: FG-GAP-like repeat-containing protein [Candidatus Angelobacter sp.]|nr:FG-GAP-like repeat-containing protein [Candidatus Angelobacter sp.]
MGRSVTIPVLPSTAAQSIRDWRSFWILPSKKDPRIPFSCILTVYAILGCTVLGFNRTPLQMLLTVVSGCLLDMALYWIFCERKLVLPLSAYISTVSLGLLLNYAHNYYLLFLPVFFTIASKYVLTYRGRHIFNPSMFGVVCALALGGGMFSSAPAYQWGGSWGMVAFMFTAALVLFVFRIGRLPLILSFLVFYAAQVLIRAYILRYHIPLETLVLGALTSARFYLFTFYMITDPKTSPSGAWKQIGWSFAIVAVDLWFHTRESLSTLFYALFFVSAARWAWLHISDIVRHRSIHLRAAFSRQLLFRIATCSLLAFGGYSVYAYVIHPELSINNPGFALVEVPEQNSGIHSEMSGVLGQTDPRVQHFAKWLMSIGDAVAVGDFDNDGLPDIFVTDPLARPEDRNALYRNLGNYRFARVEIPALKEISNHPEKYGFVAGAIFVDYDNSGAQSLFLPVAYGKSRLLKNMLPVTGRAEFVDVSDQAGISEHTTSVAATFFDYDRDGKLDLLVCNSFTPYLPDYDKPTPLNIFALPPAEYPGDRRMFHFMHESWNDASNGGLNLLFHNAGEGRFIKMDMKAVGMPQTHFSLAVGTGDFNGDGYTDLYVANDFGPDDLYLNDHGKGFTRVAGKMFGSIGKDTYKGMNASVADLDNRGWLDIYVSDIHVPLQAEGSLLWKSYPNPKNKFVPEFRDEATGRGVLNEGGFGWGAAIGDLNLDGWLDIVQANGMVNDSQDKRFAKPHNYWYAAEKVMLSPPNVHSYVDRWPDLRGYEIFGHQKNRVYLSRGAEESMQYVDVAQQVGLTQLGVSRGVALVDLNNQGVLDVIITHQFSPLTIYRNTLHERDRQNGRVHHWIGLKMEGDGQAISREAVGTQVFVTYARNGKTLRQMREVQIANGFSAQGDRRLLYGLGDYDGPIDVEVHWYGGPVEHYNNLQLDRYQTLRYRSGTK